MGNNGFHYYPLLTSPTCRCWACLRPVSSCVTHWAARQGRPQCHARGTVTRCGLCSAQACVWSPELAVLHKRWPGMTSLFVQVSPCWSNNSSTFLIENIKLRVKRNAGVSSWSVRALLDCTTLERWRSWSSAFQLQHTRGRRQKVTFSSTLQEKWLFGCLWHRIR